MKLSVKEGLVALIFAYLNKVFFISYWGTTIFTLNYEITLENR